MNLPQSDPGSVVAQDPEGPNVDFPHLSSTPKEFHKFSTHDSKQVSVQAQKGT